MNKFTNGLLVLRGVDNDPVFKKFTAYCLTGQTQEYNDFLCALYAQNAESNVKKYFQELILKDENAFSVACSAGREISPYLRDAYLSDVKKIFSAMHCLDDKPNFKLGSDVPPFDSANEEEFLSNIKKFYATNGYGQFIGNKAFYYCDGRLIPVKETSPTTLKQLKNYESEKETIRNNLSDFVTGLPYSHLSLIHI